MTRYYIATVQVLIAADSEWGACDAMAEAIRPMLREMQDDGEPQSSWIDWRYAAYDPAGCNLPGATVPVPHSGAGFEYAEEV